MWESDDIIRSTRRYLSLMLPGPPWKIRIERREILDSERPVAVIEAGSMSSPIRRVARYQGLAETILPLTISLYPALAESAETDDLRLAAQQARKLVDLMNNWVTIGIPIRGEPFGVPDRLMSGPYRFPLWNYDGVPLIGKEKGGPEKPHSVLWVSEASFSARGAFDTQAIQDPDDASRWSVIQNLQVSMEKPGGGPNTANPEEVGPVSGLEGLWEGGVHI
jgi:hypothetical protein